MLIGKGAQIPNAVPGIDMAIKRSRFAASGGTGPLRAANGPGNERICPSFK